jgi:hypothetical protein
MLLTMDLRGTPSLYIFGSPYILGGLDPDGLSSLQTSSECVDFLSNFVVLRSVDSVGSLVSILYAESFESIGFLFIVRCAENYHGITLIHWLFLRFLSAVLSVLVRLSLGLEALFMILTFSCLASSALSTGRDRTAFSTR